MISAAFHHWPEGHEFTPDSAEHLRAWLLVKAGHREVTTFPLEHTDAWSKTQVLLTVEAAIKAAGAYPFVRVAGNQMAVFRAQSIAFDRLGHKPACELFDAVGQIIEAETGIPADTLIREAEHTP